MVGFFAWCTHHSLCANSMFMNIQVIVEPGTPIGFNNIKLARSTVLSDLSHGLPNILAPVSPLFSQEPDNYTTKHNNLSSPPHLRQLHSVHITMCVPWEKIHGAILRKECKEFLCRCRAR